MPPLRGDPRAQPEVPPLPPQLPTSPAPPARKRKSRPFPRSAGVEDGGGGTEKGNYAGTRHGRGTAKTASGGQTELVRTRPLHPLLLRAPPTGFRLGHTLNSGLTLKPRPLDWSHAHLERPV